LFYVSLYDHMHQRGYVRNAPGSPMCGCSENMAVVTRADCTEISADETFRFDYDASTSTLTGTLSKVRDLDFNACQGANNKNNDLEAYYRRLVNEGKQPAGNLAKLQKTLVGTQAGKCNQAIVNFMETKGIVRSSSGSASVSVSSGNGVEVVDPDYIFEEASKSKMMPKVPGEDDGLEDEETVDVSINEESDEDYDDDQPGITAIEPDLEDDEEAEDEDDLDDDVDEDWETKGDGEKCQKHDECTSGTCENGACAELLKPEPEPVPEIIGENPIGSPPDDDKETTGPKEEPEEETPPNEEPKEETPPNEEPEEETPPNEEPAPVTSPDGDKESPSTPDDDVDEGESILFEDFEGENLLKDYGINSKRVVNSDGDSSISLRKKQYLMKVKWIDVTKCSTIKFKFMANAKGYDEASEGFRLDTKIRYLKGGGWIVNKWNTDAEWTTADLEMDQWKELDSPQIDVETGFAKAMMKFLVRGNGSNGSKMVLIDDLNVLCQV